MTTKPADPALDSQIAGRYAVLRRLGRGGMAAVYLVLDELTRRTCALKQLTIGPDLKGHVEANARFEREYRTLSELTHPRIIQVFDYGLDRAGPFYTMEVLDHGDLVARTPMPWREACLLMHDVCSSLALLHARRLVHCDISPRNVRFTADGRAKLIDFGAMVPMGRGHMVVGTPSFVAPEVLARSELDAATDLFSLGATFYFALTGRTPFSARDFTQLREAWQTPPPAPSQIVPDIPQALDRLILWLLNLDAAARPRGTFEVMQRLEACAGLEHAEPLNVGAAYLASPMLIGRQPILDELQSHLERALEGQGRAFVLRGAAGSGRSRLLSAAVLACKLRGVHVLQLDAADEGDFAGALALSEQLLELLPAAAFAKAEELQLLDLLFEPGATSSAWRLRDLTSAKLERARAQEGLHRWLLAVSTVHPLAIAVDDLQRLDAPSAGLMAQCAAHSDAARLCLVLTMAGDPDSADARETRVLLQHADCHELTPLTEAQTTKLLGSLFGDVPNVNVIGHAIHAVAAGNPKLCMDLARHLVDTGTVRYQNGHWTLPARVSPNDIPESADAPLRARILSLRPLARRLLEAQALASHQRFTREDYAILAPRASRQHVDEAILELIAQGLVSVAGTRHELVHRNWVQLLTAHLDGEEQRERHAAIAELYGDSLKSVFHRFAAKQEERGLEILLRELRARGDTSELFSDMAVNAWELGRLFERALLVADQLARSPKDSYDLLRWLVALGVVSDDRYYWEAAPRLLVLLRELSGLDDYERAGHLSDPQARLTFALQQVVERFNAAEPSARIWPPQDAIRHLATFVATSIPLAARSGKINSLTGLAQLLKPLLPLSAAVRVIYDNACATRELCVFGRVEAACALLLDAYQRFESEARPELTFTDAIRGAMAAAIGSLEVQLGLTSARRWAERVEALYFQGLMGIELQRLVALQDADWQMADRLRKRAEYVSLQQRVRPMFSNLLLIEVEIYASAADLTGLLDLERRIAVVAAKYPYWHAARLFAEASYERCRGRPEAARALFERCLQRCEPGSTEVDRPAQVWPIALGFYLELLVDMGEAETARTLGVQALRSCEQQGIAAAAHALVRGLALAEARLGDFGAARERLAQHIARYQEREVCRLYLGLLYEASAYVAIWQSDQASFEHFKALTARMYRYGQRSPLGTRHKRLADEGRQRFEGVSASIQPERAAAAAESVSQLFRRANDAADRAQLALELLCKDRGVQAGHLFLARADGVQLMASKGPNAARRELHAQASTFVAQRLAEDDETEVLDDSPITLQPVQHEFWVALECGRGADAKLVGVACLTANDNHTAHAPREPHLCGALAQQLLAAGDLA